VGAVVGTGTVDTVAGHGCTVGAAVATVDAAVVLPSASQTVHPSGGCGAGAAAALPGRRAGGRSRAGSDARSHEHAGGDHGRSPSPCGPGSWRGRREVPCRGVVDRPGRAGTTRRGVRAGAATASRRVEEVGQGGRRAAMHGIRVGGAHGRGAHGDTDRWLGSTAEAAGGQRRSIDAVQCEHAEREDVGGEVLRGASSRASAHPMTVACPPASPTIT
jgi:hypothetical protein